MSVGTHKNFAVDDMRDRALYFRDVIREEVYQRMLLTGL